MLTVVSPVAIKWPSNSQLYCMLEFGQLGWKGNIVEFHGTELTA
jgi:hypothetical protein